MSPCTLTSELKKGQKYPSLTDFQNLNAASNDITKEESELIQELDKRLFRRLVSTQWENLEVTEYWKYMEEGGYEQKLDV